MRLSEDHRHKIKMAVRQAVGDNAVVWLFGSRTDDSKRGGDIDLYIETPPLENLFKTKVRLKLRLEDLLGEQKIDTLIHQQGDPMLPIHELARKRGILL